MPNLTADFALLEPPLNDYASARSVILPLPFERTTSFGKGTVFGPEAILRASRYLETWDEELGWEPADTGIATLPPFFTDRFDLGEALAEIEGEARQHMQAGKFVVSLGGEHSLSAATIRAATQVFGPELGVVQFDAHADLRSEYEGTPHSHACVMHRVLDLGLPTVAVGLRSLSQPEAQLVEQRQLPVLWGYQLEEAEQRFPKMLANLPEQIYLTFDLDFFDPSLLPATGTPEPGGGFWTPTLRLLRHLFASKRVVAMDVVELAPLGGQPASDFTAAKLVYKAIGYRHAEPQPDAE